MNRCAIALMVLALCASVSAGPLPGPRPHPPVTPQPPPTAPNRDPLALAQRHPVIARQLAELRGDQAPATPAYDEDTVQVALSGQCGFAGCSASTLVAFVFRTRGANPTTRSVLALVTCPPVGECRVDPAEVRPNPGPFPGGGPPPPSSPPRPPKPASR